MWGATSPCMTSPYLGGSQELARYADHQPVRGLGSRLLTELYDHKFAPSSPLVDAKVNTPLLKKQLSFRFHLDESSSFSEDDETPVICLASVSFVVKQVRGTIQVAPHVRARRVFVRYTCDSWRTTHDADAVFSGQGGYFFTFTIPDDVPDYECVAFAVAAEAEDGHLTWDNNKGSNYCADVLPRMSAPRQQRQAPLSLSRKTSLSQMGNISASPRSSN